MLPTWATTPPTSDGSTGGLEEDLSLGDAGELVGDPLRLGGGERHGARHLGAGAPEPGVGEVAEVGGHRGHRGEALAVGEQEEEVPHLVGELQRRGHRRHHAAQLVPVGGGAGEDLGELRGGGDRVAHRLEALRPLLDPALLVRQGEQGLGVPPGDGAGDHKGGR
jgi:hypothetical protein